MSGSYIAEGVSTGYDNDGIFEDAHANGTTKSALNGALAHVKIQRVAVVSILKHAFHSFHSNIIKSIKNIV